MLDNLCYIELLAPVINYEILAWFHEWRDHSYFMDWKNILVRKEYIKSLRPDNPENILFKFLETLKKYSWDWKLKLVIWDSDPVVKIESFNITEIKNIYPEIIIEVIEWGDHYLWYKKQ